MPTCFWIWRCWSRMWCWPGPYFDTLIQAIACRLAVFWQACSGQQMGLWSRLGPKVCKAFVCVIACSTVVIIWLPGLLHCLILACIVQIKWSLCYSVVYSKHMEHFDVNRFHSDDREITCFFLIKEVELHPNSFEVFGWLDFSMVLQILIFGRNFQLTITSYWPSFWSCLWFWATSSCLEQSVN